MKYTLGKIIGDKGGYGNVFECKSELGQIYAVKFLKEDTEEEIVLRFQKEVRLTNRLNHPNIIKIISYSVDKDRRFYIMPRYKCSLASVISEIYNDYDRQYKVLSEILNGLIYLHSEGVIHRDLKPQNILYNSDTDIVLNDLGFGRQVNSDSERLTSYGEVFGTPRYMSPEQRRNAENVDDRTDIYALGKIIEDIVTNFNEYPIQEVQLQYVINKCTVDNKDRRISSVIELKSIVDIVYKQLLKISSDNEIDNLLAQMQLGGITDSNLIKLGLSLISANDGDKTEDFFLSLSEENYKKIEEDNLEISQKLIGILKNYYVRQWWGFGYTDTIGELCKKIYNWSADAEIKASLLYTIMSIGIDHNRFYVMGIARTLIKDLSVNPAEAIELASLLKEKRVRLSYLAISISELPEAIKEYYEK